MLLTLLIINMLLLSMFLHVICYLFIVFAFIYAKQKHYI